MSLYALIVFALAAAGGAVLAVQHFTDKKRPAGLAILHALLGAAGLVLLALPVFGVAGGGTLSTAFFLFLIAALGGFLLLSFRLRGRRLSSPVVLVHAGVAVAAFLVLLFGVIQGA